MKQNTRLSQRALSLILSLLVLCSSLPFSVFGAVQTDGSEYERTADPSTMNNWHNYFYKDADNFNTANSGGIWTDKTVLTDNAELKALGLTDKQIPSPSNRGFLGVLSAIGSNKTVTGESAVATDTVLVLDTSGSMDDNDETDINAMVNAANISIDSLMKANPNNRIGVVFFSSSATTFLPLDHYTTTANDGKYLVADHTYGGWSDNYQSSDIILSDNVKNSSNVTPSTDARDVEGGTYTARGIIQAMNLLTATSNILEQEKTPRKPVILLMTDGAATYADTDFTNPPSADRNDLGDGYTNDTDEPLVFATELTASYAKEMITKKYGSSYKCLFYTVGLDVSSQSGANLTEAVLDPVNKNTTALNTLWEDYDIALPGDSVIIGTTGGRNPDDITVTKLTDTSITLSSKYVDKYLPAANAGELENAFQEILTDIALQTTYYPTLVDESGSELSGYISFVDKLGRYMKVDKVNGLIINNKFYSGAHMANALFNENLMGTVQNPSELGDEFIWSINERLGITGEVSRGLVASAAQSRQMYYNSDEDFSNYFGWYSDADNKFISFCGEGTTVPENAVYTNKSYIYLGEADPATNVRESDMMYVTVRVRETIATGEQEVDFAIPANLIPTVTYNVALDSDGNISTITTNAESVSPIRLVYTTELDKRINKWTAGEIVDSQYKNYVSPQGNNFTLNEDSSLNFYNNKWGFDGQTGYGTYNPYAYYYPSHQNERHYFQDKSFIYLKDGDNYLPYNEDTNPKDDASNTYYYGITIYAIENGSPVKYTQYAPVRPEILDAAARDASGEQWYIRPTFVRRDYADVTINKTSNPTETSEYYAVPFFEYTSGGGLASSEAEGHSSIVGTTLGNNGKIKVETETGVKITKELEAGVNSGDKKFTFKIETDNTALGTVDAYKLDSEGNGTETTVSFNSNGVATVDLKAGESIYIGGMAEGDIVKITEAIDTEYALKSIVITDTGVTTPVNGTEAQIVLDKADMPEAVFTNGTRETAAINVFKRVIHDYGTAYKIPNKKFDITLRMTFNGEALSNYPLADPTKADAKTDADGTYTVSLAHGESILIGGIPEGTVVNISESPYSNFTASINEASGTANDGVITVGAATANAEIVNTYDPDHASASNIKVSGIKKYKDSNGNDIAWKLGDSFTFAVQQLISDKWVTLPNNANATKTIEIAEGDTEYIGQKKDYEFTFTDVFKDVSYEAPGTYSYRVYEIPDAVPGINYDITSHRFEVTVADDNMSGKLQITEVKVTDGDQNISVEDNQVTATFTNVYDPEDAVVNITLNKIVENKTGSPEAEGKLEGYKFQIMETDDAFGQNGVWKDVDGATSSTGVLKHTIEYGIDDIGKHYYLIKEVDTRTKAQKDAGWKFDENLYEVVVEVSDPGNAGVLLATAYLSDNGATGATSTVVVNFTNKYEPEPTEVVIIDNPPSGVVRTDFVRKQLKGRKLVAEEFNFTIYDENGIPYTTGTNEGAAADAEAEVNFEKNLTFDKVGEYRFSVAEDIPEDNKKLPSVAYDSAKYYFTVTVTDSGEGYLEAKLTVDNGIDNSNQVTFVNIYDAVDKTYSLNGKKVLENFTLSGNKFSFYIQECDAQGVATGTKTLIYNDENGNIPFPEVTYTKGGTTYYLIEENIPTGDKMGIVYDETKFIAKIEIDDNPKTGMLEETVSYTMLKAGESQWVNAPNGISFTNTYSPAAAMVAFEGTKEVTGKALKDKAYSFELYEANEDFNPQGDALETVKNGKPNENNIGKFTFKAVSLNEAKLYRFLIREFIPAEKEKGVTYDEVFYRITVDVTDNQRGQLEPHVSIRTNAGVPVDNIKFVNKYFPTEGTSVSFEGSKTLDKAEGTNVDFGDFKFTFDFYETNDKFEASGNPLDTMDADENGKFTFGAEYNPEDDLDQTYYYVIKERNNSEGGISYSKEEYRITVNIVDEDKDGAIEAKASITDKNGKAISQDKISFVNKYDFTKKGTFDVEGKKTLNGRELKENEFKFQIFKADSKGNPIGDAIKTVTNGADGNFNLKGIEAYTHGANYFVIKENSDKENAVANVTYDTSAYLVTVNAVDKKDGTLEITDKSIVKLGSDNKAETVEFENTYTAPVIESPKTGNALNILLWLGLMLAGCVAITYIFLGRKQKSTK